MKQKKKSFGEIFADNHTIAVKDFADKHNLIFKRYNKKWELDEAYLEGE